MHELSIAMSIVEVSEQESQKRRGAKINAVHLRLGRMAGVVKEALLSCYEMACEGTELEGSRLLIEEVPVVVNCPMCQARRTLDSIQFFVCPVCGSPVSEIVHGREMEVCALELQDLEAAP
jgi:hydrogenase nickel incorporation protein HypA/HybF